MNIYDFNVTTIDEENQSLSEYKNKVLLIVNTASKCGFTPQYKGLEELYKKYGNEKFEVLGFPCDQFMHQEPGTSAEIKNFCEINFGVTFPLFQKTDVNGENAHPLFKYLTEQTSGILNSKIKWNFTKFLIDSKGNIVNRFAPSTEPEKLSVEIEKLINEL
ncbi:glutathione peroxidase [Tepidibacter mesophilus]|uniref:glutathione peroxidase n=1 Tax=Tepidibacter mesophilus TaxID=655607 RepID=UPI000C0885D2|nr:glutathione peroxidase [Tepidibacter mesophilus]